MSKARKSAPERSMSENKPSKSSLREIIKFVTVIATFVAVIATAVGLGTWIGAIKTQMQTLVSHRIPGIEGDVKELRKEVAKSERNFDRIERTMNAEIIPKLDSISDSLRLGQLKIKELKLLSSRIQQYQQRLASNIARLATSVDTLSRQGRFGEQSGDLALRFDLARVYVAIREYDRSISEYHRLLELGADPARVHNNMGIAYFLKGEVREATQSFKQAMDLDPEDEGIKGNFELTMSTLGKEARIALAREIGVSIPEGGKAVEFEVDEESFYWRE